MRVVPYDELRNPDGFLQLMVATFWWAAHPNLIVEMRQNDERFRDPFGYALVCGRTPVGFVGTADIPVRLADGSTEKALGIHHVATLPDYARRGIALRLLEHVEDEYRQKGYRFSFLFTSRTLVAWHLYRKIGYQDLACGKVAPRCHKLFAGQKKAPKIRHPKPNYRLVEKLHEELTRTRCGFAVRNPGWLKALEKTWKPGPGFVVACRDGYALVEDFRGALWIDEILCRDQRAYLRILARLLRRKPGVLIDTAVWDPVLRNIYRRQGFRFWHRTYGTLMAKSLVPTISIHTAFGPRFYWTVADQF